MTKFLSTIREFSSLLFNKPNGEDVEIKPASRAADAAAEYSYNLPDGGTPTAADDTIALLAEIQTFTQKTIDADQNTITNIEDENIKTGAAIDATKISNGSVDNTEFNKLGTAGANLDGELVVTDSAQILKNKTIDSSLNTITNIVDADIKADAAINANKISSGSVANADFDKLATSGADGLGEIVETDSAQTLTNKTLTSPVLSDLRLDDTSADHKYIFTVSELTLDRNINLPLLTSNDTFVFEDHTQTLSNKTLDNPLVQNLDIESSNAAKYIIGVGTTSGDRTISLPDLLVDTEFATTNIPQVLQAKTLTQVKYSEASVSIASNTFANNLATILRVSGTGPLNTITGGADGDVKILVNETGSDLVIAEDFGASGFYTGAGADIIIKDNASLSGGLSLANLSGAGTLSSNTHYLVDSSTAFSVSLPAGTPGAVIRLSDVNDLWGTNNLTITPDGVELIDGDADLIADVSGVWVQLMWDGTEWKSDDPLNPSLNNLTGDLSINGKVSADNGFISKDLSNANLTIDSGYTLSHPNLTIDSGTVYTNNGSMWIGNTLITNGTLIDNGTSIVY
jgi:hypothetical protein